MNECSYEIDVYEDTWGFYVDIEKEYNDENIFKLTNQSKDLKYASDYNDYYDEYERKHIDRNITNILIKISSTTFVTICLTYFIMCVL